MSEERTTPGSLEELLVSADSYLSLLWHRHVPWDRKDTDLQINVERTIGRLRKASASLVDVRSQLQGVILKMRQDATDLLAKSVDARAIQVARRLRQQADTLTTIASQLGGE